MSTALSVEPTGASDAGPCECCGNSSRCVWGFVHTPRESLAAYYAQWTVGRVPDHGANFDLVVGKWGDGTVAADRSFVALAYRLEESGPSFMVIDGPGRPRAKSELVGRALSRSEVIDQPIAAQAFAIVDAVLAQDARVAELLGGRRMITKPSRPWWKVWKS